jgi:hypothetical protein
MAIDPVTGVLASAFFYDFVGMCRLSLVLQEEFWQ